MCACVHVCVYVCVCVCVCVCKHKDDDKNGVFLMFISVQGNNIYNILLRRVV